MNILILTTHLNTGGITSYLLTLAKGLIYEGHRVYLASSGGNQFEDFTAVGVEHFVVDIRTKSELNPKLFSAVGKLQRFIRIKNIHVIHANTRVTQVMAWVLHKTTQRPYLSTCHGFFKTRLTRRLFPFWGQTVIAISEPVKEHLEKDFKVDPQQIAFITNGLDLGKFLPFREDYRREKRKMLGFDGHLLIGIIARLSDVKGHAVLIEAMEEVVRQKSNAKLLIVGEGKEEQNLRQLVARLNLNNCIYFYPVMNKAMDFLEIFDVFVMPSLQEGLGLSVMEAQACGLPVVASNVGGLPSLIEHEKTGLLVPSQDPAALAKAILELLNDRNKALALGKEARKFIEANFSSRVMVEKTEKVYERLASNAKK
jgi:glycosyltransferase involved in cell wall biosynthesis